MRDYNTMFDVVDKVQKCSMSVISAKAGI